MTKVTKRKKLPAKKGESYKERILKRIKVDQKSNCWNYTGTLRNGYGFLNYKGKNKSAHRIMLMEITGLYKDDKLMFACHKCSNKACVNPDHLYWGTRSDNTKDMFKEGVHNFLKMDLRGENHPLSKISDNDVLLARSMKNDGFTITEISKKLGYKKTTLNNIIYKNSKRFKHLLK